jgi:hypothetical protein
VGQCGGGRSELGGKEITAIEAGSFAGLVSVKSLYAFATAIIA